MNARCSPAAAQAISRTFAQLEEHPDNFGPIYRPEENISSLPQLESPTIINQSSASTPRRSGDMLWECRGHTNVLGAGDDNTFIASRQWRKGGGGRSRPVNHRSPQELLTHPCITPEIQQAREILNLASEGHHPNTIPPWNAEFSHPAPTRQRNSTNQAGLNDNRQPQQQQPNTSAPSQRSPIASTTTSDYHQRSLAAPTAVYGNRTSQTSNNNGYRNQQRLPVVSTAQAPPRRSTGRVAGTNNGQHYGQRRAASNNNSRRQQQGPPITPQQAPDNQTGNNRDHQHRQ